MGISLVVIIIIVTVFGFFSICKCIVYIKSKNGS